jgi:hypothetical protein
VATVATGAETHMALAYSVVVEGIRLILLFNLACGIWGVKCENSEEMSVFASRASILGRGDGDEECKMATR